LNSAARRYSERKGLIRAPELESIIQLLTELGFNLFHPALIQRTTDGSLAVLAGLKEFQEHLGGDLSVSLLDGIGKNVEVGEISENLMLECITWLEQRCAPESVSAAPIDARGSS
jgi:3-dehydroquinate synthase